MFDPTLILGVLGLLALAITLAVFGRPKPPPPEMADTDRSALLYLKLVRDSKEPALARLSDDRLLELGRATANVLRDYRGDVDRTVASALSAGVPRDVVLPVVVGAGFFLCPEFKNRVASAYAPR